jgi:ferredoxin-type protein NapH
MNYLIRSVAVLLGADPKKPAPEDYTDEAKALHAEQKGDRSRIEKIHIESAHKAAHKTPEKWRRRRWTVLILVNLLFVLSYQLDIQMLEGSLTASRFVGFHMADLNSALQVMLAYKEVLINLMIGTSTVLIFWWLLGGRTFCSWVCPYHLVAEWAEMAHDYLAKKKIVRDHPFDRRVRTVFWVIFALLAFVTGYTVFETISPTGILSRALIYGPGVALVWVATLLLFEIFYSKRAWCRYACPIGLTYGLVGAVSPLKVTYNLATCFHEAECKKVCEVPHVLDMVVKGRATRADMFIGADCTHCGRCVDACPTNSLNLEFKGLGRLLK